MTTPSIAVTGSGRPRADRGTESWTRLVRQIADLEELLQEAAASPDQDAFGERAMLTRLLAARRQTLRQLDVGTVFSERGARRSDVPGRRPRAEDA